MQTLCVVVPQNGRQWNVGLIPAMLDHLNCPTNFGGAKYVNRKAFAAARAFLHSRKKELSPRRKERKERMKENDSGREVVDAVLAAAETGS